MPATIQAESHAAKLQRLLGDGPLVVDTAWVTAFASVFLFAALLSTAAPADADPANQHCEGLHQVRPTSIVLTCADGYNYIDGIVWESDTVGHGTQHENDCNPYCAAGTMHSRPVKVGINGSTVVVTDENGSTTTFDLG